ncbi:MAG: hypothetical protein Q7S03_00195 [bacterium]|nr:hypothetical protein [bacterium]
MKENDFRVIPFPNDPETWSTEQWRHVTRHWDSVVELVARKARVLSYEERVRRGGNLFEDRFAGESPGYTEVVCNIMQLSDSALDRAIASLCCIIEELRIVEGRQICPFTTLRRLPPLEDLSHGETAFDIPIKFRGMIGVLRGTFVSYEGQSLILPRTCFLIKSLREYRIAKRFRAEFVGDQSYYLNMTKDTEEEEAGIRQCLGSSDVSIVQNGIFKDSLGEDTSFPLPYQDFLFWRTVEMRIVTR